MIKCDNCNNYFSPARENMIFTIFNKYYIEISYEDLDNSQGSFIYPLLNELVEDIKNSNDINRFKDFYYYIDEHEVEYNCPECNRIVHQSYAFSLPDRLFLYIEDYIKFTLNNISIKYTGYPIKEFGIDTLDFSQLNNVLNQLPEDYCETKKLLVKLFKIKNILPVLGGRGGELEIIDEIINELSSDIFGIFLSIIITSGVYGIRDKVKKIKVRNTIRRKIKQNGKYWDDISFEDLEKYLQVPRDYKQSKEQLIEEILSSKIDTYKSRLIEKLRKKLNNKQLE